MKPTSLPGQRAARKRWPLVLLAAPAGVAIWSGWVALGQMCGFGTVHPLPGIVDTFKLNTAITLPIGVEAYSAYALGTWLTSAAIPAKARRFAAWSALGGLSLGLIGQVIYHVLEALGFVNAPIPIVVFVSSLPVVALGAAATLHHLTSEYSAVPEATAEPTGHQAEKAQDGATESAALTNPERNGARLGAEVTTGVCSALSAGAIPSTSETDSDRTSAPTPEGDDTGQRGPSTAAEATPSGWPNVSDLLPIGIEIDDALRAEGRTLNRRLLLEQLKDRRIPCGTDRANELMRQLKGRTSPDGHPRRLEAVAS